MNPENWAHDLPVYWEVNTITLIKRTPRRLDNSLDDTNENGKKKKMYKQHESNLGTYLPRLWLHGTLPLRRYSPTPLLPRRLLRPAPEPCLLPWIAHFASPPMRLFQQSPVAKDYWIKTAFYNRKRPNTVGLWEHHHIAGLKKSEIGECQVRYGTVRCSTQQCVFGSKWRHSTEKNSTEHTQTKYLISIYFLCAKRKFGSFSRWT